MSLLHCKNAYPTTNPSGTGHIIDVGLDAWVRQMLFRLSSDGMRDLKKVFKLWGTQREVTSSLLISLTDGYIFFDC